MLLYNIKWSNHGAQPFSLLQVLYNLSTLFPTIMEESILTVVLL